MQKPGNQTKTMIKLVFLVSRLLKDDSRALKEAKTFVKYGYDVHAICWDQGGQSPAEELVDGIKVKCIKVPFTKFFSKPHVSPSALIFWFKALMELFKRKPDIIHCAEFYTMPIGFLFRKIKGVRLVYDSYENYPAMAPDFLPSALAYAVTVVDNLFVREVDCLVLASDERKALYNYPGKTIVALNSPRLIKQVCQSTSDIFTIFYAGGVTSQSSANLVVEAVQQLEGVKLVIAGWGQRIKKLDEISEKNANISYLGQISGEEAISRLFTADATFAFYAPVNLNNIYTASCKVFDAMMTGKPIIVNKEVTASRMVLENHCGIAISFGNLDELKKAIFLLKDDKKLRAELGINGREAFKKKFDWTLCERNFVKDYKNTLLMER